MNKKGAYQIYPIGYIRRSESGIHLEILEPFRPALRQLEHFGHVMVLWWADRHDNEKSRSIMQIKTWLPQSDYQRAPAPGFELYDENFDPKDPSSEMYIYVPVK